MKKKGSEIWDVAVVGAGASGMMAAITAAEDRSVLLLEHLDKPGKKILATGNGKCNFTNANMTVEHFYGSHELVESVLKQFGTEDTIAFFQKIGIWPKEKNGYYYPNSGQAVSVAEALVAECNRKKVRLVTGCNMTSLFPDKYGFQIETTQGNFRSRNVILATGLLAAPKLGSDGSVIPVLKQLGHRFSPILPALCGFLAKGMDFKKVSGVRCEVALTLVIEGKKEARERGELQLTDYGISGIPAFQISSPAVRALHAKKRVSVSIDFMPQLSLLQLEQELERRMERDAGEKTAADTLCGLFNQKLIPVLLKHSGTDVHADAGKINVRKLADVIHNYQVELTQVRDFSYAQVCTGGIRTEELDVHTLESKLVPGLYFAGELLDVDGICGGYNLQWAWSSGYVAGNAVLKNGAKKC